MEFNFGYLSRIIEFLDYMLLFILYERIIKIYLLLINVFLRIVINKIFLS